MSKTLSVTFKKSVALKDGSTIETGTRASVQFNAEKNGVMLLVTLPSGRVVNLAARRGNDYFGSPFQKMPSERKLGRWSMDSICETVLGNDTEPDGHDEFGAPSWLLCLGMI